MRLAEDTRRKAWTAAMAGDEATNAAIKLAGTIAERVSKAGKEAREAAATGFEIAEKVHGKAEQADITGDECIDTTIRAMVNP